MSVAGPRNDNTAPLWIGNVNCNTSGHQDWRLLGTKLESGIQACIQIQSCGKL